MKINSLTLKNPGFPAILREIASPPQRLFVAGEPLESFMDRPRVAIVGSRKVSAYGREVTTRLAQELAERGIVITSGLALGVDALAHKAALEAGGATIAMLPGSIEKIYPASHTQLAQRIVGAGGTLVSEYAVGSDIYRTNFIARNRLVSGLADAILITEAAEKSGSLHTARFALEQGKDVLAVPGSIFSETSVGTNNLIKAGATPVTSYLDVLHALGLDEAIPHTTRRGGNREEQLLLDLLAEDIRGGEELLLASGLDIALFNQTLTMLEVTSQIRSLGANQWSLA